MTNDVKSNMTDVFLFIKEKFGKEIFKEKARLIGVFSDVAPMLKKERQELETAMSHHIEKYFTESNKSDVPVIIRIKNEIGFVMSDEALNMIIEAFSAVFELNPVEEAAKSGDEIAQKELAFMYYYGNGVEQSDEEAVKYFRKSAEQGNRNAQNWLGWMYEHGRGTEKNYTEALKWYMKSALQNFASAQRDIGRMYYYGKGVLRDYSEAKKWFTMAAKQGDETAKKYLEILA